MGMKMRMEAKEEEVSCGECVLDRAHGGVIPSSFPASFLHFLVLVLCLFLSSWWLWWSRWSLSSLSLFAST